VNIIFPSLVAIFNLRRLEMVKVIKSTIARKPEDLVKLKYNTGVIFGRNIKPLKNRKKIKNDKNPR
tara:strand:+ start:901 stop:1098 length:198 start_codon:yes stop_codon:yes gene_type:complete